MLNTHGEVLICQRPAHKLYPGQWEFPGGKIEPGEAAAQALARELREELGVRVTDARPLIRVRHAYPELAVDLDVWAVTGFEGTVASTEHPAVAWVPPGDLPRCDLLAADRPIVAALRLPPHCIFTPGDAAPASLVAHLPRLPRGALLRLRLPRLDAAAYADLARELLPRCRALGLRLLLDRDPAMVARLGADGWHASARAVARLQARPLPADRWFGASAHDADEVNRARQAGADFIVLGPVHATATHPGATAMGWDGFAGVAAQAGVPVYAIGGLGPGDARRAWQAGAQGVAGISAYWTGLLGSGGSASSAGIA